MSRNTTVALAIFCVLVVNLSATRVFAEMKLYRLKDYHGCSEFDHPRDATYRNHPFGCESFVAKLEQITSRPLRRRPPGPPSKLRDR